MEVKRVRTQQPKKNLWKPEEDLILKNYVEAHGEGNWATVSERSGLKRGGKSCRLRWKNYLRPNIKRGEMSKEEEDLIIRMHKLLGNRWSLIAGRLPGRTDNEVKNYWNTHLNKKCLLGKRKAIDSSHHHHEDKEENIHKKNKLCEAEANGSPNMTISPSPTKQCLDGRKVEEKEEESTITSNPWKDERNSLNCSSTDMEYPIMGGNNNAAFMFDDEPLIAYLDSFVLFEAFGWEGEEGYAEMQSVIETRVSSTDRTHVTKENLHTLWW